MVVEIFEVVVPCFSADHVSYSHVGCVLRYGICR